VCHTDEFPPRFRRRSGGSVSVIFGHEGAGNRRGRGVRRSPRSGRCDHFIPLYTPECRHASRSWSPKTILLCTAIRATRARRASCERISRFFFDGHSRWCITRPTGILAFPITRAPEIWRSPKSARTRPSRGLLPIGFGVTTARGGHQYRQRSSPRESGGVFGPGRHWA